MPHLRVFVLAGVQCAEKCSGDVPGRPWITVMATNGDVRAALARLRHEHGIARISCIGGRTAATSLVEAGLVQDIYLTTSAIDAGEPKTPWYVGGKPPGLSVIVRKREDTSDQPMVFEHLAIAL